MEPTDNRSSNPLSLNNPHFSCTNDMGIVALGQPPVEKDTSTDRKYSRLWSLVQTNPFDKALSELLQRNIINSDLHVVKSNVLIPNLSCQVIKEIFGELSKTRVLKTRETLPNTNEPKSYVIYFNLIDLVKNIWDLVEEIEIVGGTASYMLTSMLESILEKLGLEDPKAFLNEELRGEWLTPPADLDIRFYPKNQTEEGMKQITVRIRQWFATKLPDDIEDKDSYFYAYGMIKHSTNKGENTYAALAIGDREGNNIDIASILKLARNSFLIRDALSLPIKNLVDAIISEKVSRHSFEDVKETSTAQLLMQAKHSQASPCDWLIHRLLKGLKAEHPTTIDYMGWPLLISLFTKGKRSFDENLEGILFAQLKNWATTKNEDFATQIVQILKKTLANHHAKDADFAAFAITLNACLYLQRHDSSLVQPVWKGMKPLFEGSKNKFIGNVCNQIAEGDGKDVSALLQLEALCSITKHNPEISWITHEGQVAVQRRVNQSYLLFEFTPISALETLKSVENKHILLEVQRLIETSTFDPSFIDPHDVKKIAHDFLKLDSHELQSLGCFLILGCENKLSTKPQSTIDLTIELAKLNNEELAHYAFILWNKLTKNGDQKTRFFTAMVQCRPDLACALLAQESIIKDPQLNAFIPIYRKVSSGDSRIKQKYWPQILRHGAKLIEKYMGNNADPDFLKTLYREFTKTDDILTVLKVFVQCKSGKSQWFETWTELFSTFQDKVRLWQLFEPLQTNLNPNQLRQLVALYKNTPGIPDGCWIRLIETASELKNVSWDPLPFKDIIDLLNAINWTACINEVQVFCRAANLFTTQNEVQLYLPKIKKSSMEISHFLQSCLLELVKHPNENENAMLLLLNIFLIPQKFTPNHEDAVSDLKDWIEYIGLIHSVVSCLPKQIVERLSFTAASAHAPCKKLRKLDKKRALELWQSYFSLFEDSKDILTRFIYKHLAPEKSLKLILALVEVFLFFETDSDLFPKKSFQVLKKACLDKSDKVNLLLNDLFPRSKRIENKEDLNSIMNELASMSSKEAQFLGCALRIVNEEGILPMNRGTPKYWPMQIAEKGYTSQAHNLLKLFDLSSQDILKFIDSSTKGDLDFACKYVIEKKKFLKEFFISGTIKIFSYCADHSKEKLSETLSKLLPHLSNRYNLSLEFFELMVKIFKAVLSQSDQKNIPLIVEKLNAKYYKKTDYPKLKRGWKECWYDSLQYPNCYPILNDMIKENFVIEHEESEIEMYFRLYSNNREQIPSTCWLYLIRDLGLVKNQHLHKSVLNFLFEKYFREKSDKLLFSECVKIVHSSSILYDYLSDNLDRDNVIELCHQALLILGEEKNQKYFNKLLSVYQSIPFLSVEKERFDEHVKSSSVLLKGLKKKDDVEMHKPNVEIMLKAFDELLEININEALHFIHIAWNTFFTSNPKLYIDFYKRMIKHIDIGYEEEMHKWASYLLLKKYLDEKVVKHYDERAEISVSLINAMLKVVNAERLLDLCDYMNLLLDGKIFTNKNNEFLKICNNIIENLVKHFKAVDKNCYRDLHLKIFTILFHTNSPNLSNYSLLENWIEYIVSLNFLSKAWEVIKRIESAEIHKPEFKHKIRYKFSTAVFSDTKDSFFNFFNTVSFEEFLELFTDFYTKISSQDEIEHENIILKTLEKADLVLDYCIEAKKINHFIEILEACAYEQRSSRAKDIFLANYCFPWIFKYLECSTEIRKEVCETLSVYLEEDSAHYSKKSERVEKAFKFLYEQIYERKKVFDDDSLELFHKSLFQYQKHLSQGTRISINFYFKRSIEELIADKALSKANRLLYSYEGTWLRTYQIDDFMAVTLALVDKSLLRGDASSASENLITLLNHSNFFGNKQFLNSYLQTLQLLNFIAIDPIFSPWCMSRAFDLISRSTPNVLTINSAMKETIDELVNIFYSFSPETLYMKDNLQLESSKSKTFNKMIGDLNRMGLQKSTLLSENSDFLVTLSEKKRLTQSDLKQFIHYLRCALNGKEQKFHNLCHQILQKQFHEKQTWENNERDMFLIWLYGLQLYMHHLNDEGKYLLNDFSKFLKAAPRYSYASNIDLGSAFLRYFLGVYWQKAEIPSHEQWSKNFQGIFHDALFSSSEKANEISDFSRVDLSVLMALFYTYDPKQVDWTKSIELLLKIDLDLLKTSSHFVLLEALNRLIELNTIKNNSKGYDQLQLILKNIRLGMKFYNMDISSLIDRVTRSCDYRILQETCLLLAETPDIQKHLEVPIFLEKTLELVHATFNKKLPDPLIKGIAKLISHFSSNRPILNKIKTSEKFDKIVIAFFNNVSEYLQNLYEGPRPLFFYVKFFAFCSGTLELCTPPHNEMIRNRISEKAIDMLSTCFLEESEIFYKVLHHPIVKQLGTALETLKKAKNRIQEVANLDYSFLKSVELSLFASEDELNRSVINLKISGREVEWNIFRANVIINSIKKLREEQKSQIRNLNNKQAKSFCFICGEIFFRLKNRSNHNQIVLRYNTFDSEIFRQLLDLFGDFNMNCPEFKKNYKKASLQKKEDPWSSYEEAKKQYTKLKGTKPLVSANQK